MFLFSFTFLNHLIKKINTENKEITLTEKFILVFILTGTIISILTGIEGFYSIQITQNQLINFWNHFYMNMSFIIIIFYIFFHWIFILY